MYGDTHITPAPLLPRPHTMPPADAFEVYFPAPLSLSLLADSGSKSPNTDHVLPQLARLYARAVQCAVTQLQRTGGYVTDKHGTEPARLEIAAISENSIPGTDTVQVHAHVYIGRTARALADRRRRPVDLTRLHRAADSAWRTYLRNLTADTTAALGLVWGPLPGHHPSDLEIVEPPFADLIVGQKLEICSGPFSRPYEQILADATWRSGIREMERTIAADEARSAS